MTGKSKRPRLQTTAASDLIASPPSRQFTHSSNSSTRTRQIVTTARVESSEIAEPSYTTPSHLNEMNSPTTLDYIPDTDGMELDPPAGIELRTKARRYVNSVSS